MNNSHTDLNLRPAASLTTLPKRKSPFECNTEANPLGAKWTPGWRAADGVDILSEDRLIIGKLNGNYSRHSWPLIDESINGASKFIPFNPLPYEITNLWVCRYGGVYPKLKETTPHFQIVDEKTGAIIFTSNIAYGRNIDRENIENFGKRMTELIGSARFKNNIVEFKGPVRRKSRAIQLKLI